MHWFKPFLYMAPLFFAFSAQAATLKVLPVAYSELEGWQEDSLDQFFEALLASCDRIKFKKETDWIHPSKLGGKVRNWLPLCTSAKKKTKEDPERKRRFIEQFFAPHRVISDGKEIGTFTGYFEASLEGSLSRSNEYRYPIYKMPPGFKSGDNYYTRAQIDDGVLSGKGLELLWVKDDVALFFAHVQGSATVKLDSGKTMRIGFAAKTAHPYRAIGAYLRDRGYIEAQNLNAESIKAWLYMNPDRREEVYAYNPSYIFFKELKHQGGPIGGQGAALTAERSIAVDKELIPYGIPIWLDTTLTQTQKPYRRLMISQDTGSAIKGGIRGDIFFGYGEEAEQKAAFQNSEGSWFLFLPRN